VSEEARCIAAGRATRIRRFTRRDVDLWLAWPPHPDPLYSCFDPPRMSPAMRDAWYDDLVHQQAQLPFTIETLEGEMVGRLFLRHVRRDERSSVLGIDLDPRVLGRGLGTDALLAFLERYFASGAFSMMLLTVAAYNQRARRSYRRCGFRPLHTHWDRFKSRADVLRDPRYARIRHLFRPAGRGVQALMHDMIVESPPRPVGSVSECATRGPATYTPPPQNSQNAQNSAERGREPTSSTGNPPSAPIDRFPSRSV
jgi:diamine N-acetyltransferase